MEITTNMVADQTVYIRPHPSFNPFIFRLADEPMDGVLPPGFLPIQANGTDWYAIFLGRNAERLYKGGKQFGKVARFLTWAHRAPPKVSDVTP